MHKPAHIRLRPIQTVKMTGHSLNVGFKAEDMMKKITIARGLCLVPSVACGVIAFAFKGWPFGHGVFICFAAICILFLWFALRGHIPRQRVLMLFSSISGIVVGWLGMAGGMVWAIYRYPESNLAPIWGIFSTGPIGFFVGAVLGVPAGLLIQHRKARKARPTQQPDAHLQSESALSD